MDTWHEEEAKAECIDLRIRARQQDAQIARLTRELAEAKQDTDRLDWMEQNPDVVSYMADDRWSYVVREYEDGWDTEYGESFETIREAIDAARKGD